MWWTTLECPQSCRFQCWQHASPHGYSITPCLWSHISTWCDGNAEHQQRRKLPPAVKSTFWKPSRWRFWLLVWVFRCGVCWFFLIHFFNTHIISLNFVILFFPECFLSCYHHMHWPYSLADLFPLTLWITSLDFSSLFSTSYRIKSICGEFFVCLFVCFIFFSLLESHLICPKM